MGYACPVCEDPQADGEHLANHLAFSALLGRTDHESWLNEHAPDWDEGSPTELAERVTPHVEEVDYPDPVVEPADGESELTPPDPEPFAAGTQPGAATQPGAGMGQSSLDPTTREAIEEARELTRQRRANAEPGAADGDRDADAENRESDDGNGK